MRCRHKNLYDARSAVRWASQVASALAALHEQQPAYVHNDVKADNVFLTEQPSIFSPRDAKLGDLKPHRCACDALQHNT
jgi:serine/threonine protein kinase